MALSGAQRKLLLVSNMALIIRLIHFKLSEGCTLALKAVLTRLTSPSRLRGSGQGPRSGRKPSSADWGRMLSSDLSLTLQL